MIDLNQPPQKKQYLTAQEFTADYVVGDIETSEQRLRELRNKYGANIGAMTEEQRKHCRQESIIFLTLLDTNRTYKGLGKEGLQPLINYAKYVIAETPEFEADYPSRGLEEILQARLIA